MRVNPDLEEHPEGVAKQAYWVVILNRLCNLKYFKCIFWVRRFIINSGLLFSGFSTVFSGLLIQFQYHIGNHSKCNYSLGFDYSTWSSIHKISISLFTVLVIFHLALHWKWYKTVIGKRLLNKNKQVIKLSLIFIVVAITGFIPWIIDLMRGNELIRKGIIELHDKIAIILTIYFIWHIAKRFTWFLTAIKRIKNNKHSTP